MDGNPYYAPETWGLIKITELNEDEPYQFHIIVLWQHEDGRLFWGVDSGCSCPSPFEDFTEFSDLEHLDHSKRAWKLFEQTVQACTSWDPVDKVGLLRQANNLLTETDKKTQDKYNKLQRKIARTGSLF